MLGGKLKRPGGDRITGQTPAGQNESLNSTKYGRTGKKRVSGNLLGDMLWPSKGQTGKMFYRSATMKKKKPWAEERDPLKDKTDQSPLQRVSKKDG